MANEGLKELYIDELKDLYSAENQLLKALPKMARLHHRKNFKPDSKSISNRRVDMSHV